MATTTTSGHVKPPSAVDEAVAGERKPPLTQMNILVMTLGFFGNSFGFGIVFSAVNPLFLYIGASEHDLPILKHRRTHHRPVHPAPDRGVQRQDLERPVGSP